MLVEHPGVKFPRVLFSVKMLPMECETVSATVKEQVHEIHATVKEMASQLQAQAVSIALLESDRRRLGQLSERIQTHSDRIRHLETRLAQAVILAAAMALVIPPALEWALIHRRPAPNTATTPHVERTSLGRPGPRHPAHPQAS